MNSIKNGIAAVIFDFFGVLIDENTQQPITQPIAFLEQCAAQKVPVYLLTNALEHKLMLYKAQHPDLFMHFSAIITPHEAGYKKPDPRIFLYAITQFNLRPAITLFIDDTYDNVASARSVGLQTIWYCKNSLLDHLLDS